MGKGPLEEIRRDDFRTIAERVPKGVKRRGSTCETGKAKEAAGVLLGSFGQRSYQLISTCSIPIKSLDQT